MPFSTSLEIISEESQTNPRVPYNMEDLRTSKDSISSRSFQLLQEKDAELEKLQKRVRVLERMAAQFENRKLKFKLQDESVFADESRVQDDSGDATDIHISETTFIPRRSWQLLQHDVTEENILRPNHLEEDDAIPIMEVLHSNNLQLKKELLIENRMRMQDRKCFIEVLDELHAALSKLRTQPDMAPCQEFVELASQWFRKEITRSQEKHDLVHVTEDVTSPKRASSREQRVFPSSWSSASLSGVKDDSNFCKVANRVERALSERLSRQLATIAGDLSAAQRAVQTSQERVAQEQRIQQVAQAAWRARFDIQLKTIKRLESRYRKVCRCLMNFRRKVKGKRPEKRKSLSNLENAQKTNDRDSYSAEQKKEVMLRKIEGAAYLHKRLESAGAILAENKKHIQQLSYEKEALEKEIVNLKQELLFSNSNNVIKNIEDDNQGTENSSNFEKNCQLDEKCDLLASQVLSLKDELDLAQIEVNVLKDENNSLLLDKNLAETNLNKAKEQLQEMEEVWKQRLAIELSKQQSCEQKLSTLYRESAQHVQEARHRISIANRKLREFFKMIQIFLEKVDEQQFFMKSKPLDQACKLASSILNVSSSKEQELLKQTEHTCSDYEKWTTHCRSLAKQENFAEEMGKFLFTLAAGITEASNDCGNMKRSTEYSFE